MRTTGSGTAAGDASPIDRRTFIGCSASLAAPLTGSPTAASWDSTLADAMREAGRRIEEELLADDPLSQLA